MSAVVKGLIASMLSDYAKMTMRCGAWTDTVHVLVWLQPAVGAVHGRIPSMQVK